MGWSALACSGAVCVEDDSKHSCAKFIEELQLGSERFGTQTVAQIGYGSLSCGHTNQGLVAIECGVPCDHESLCCDGHMSKSKIVAKRPKMGTVLEYGMRWLVLKAVVITYFNDIPRIVQAARQAIGQVQKVEGIFELLEAIQSLISGSGQATDWDMIIATVGQSESPFKEDIPEMCEFTRIYGGGVKGQFLK